MASPVYIWFRSEVFPWRSLAAVCWALVCLPFLLLLTVLLAQCSLWEPLAWLQGTVSSIVSLHFVLMYILCGLSLGAVAWFSMTYLTVSLEVSSSRLSQYLSLLYWTRLPLLVVCALAGALGTWATVRLMGPDIRTLTVLHDTPTYKRVVLNEGHLFLLLSGIFAGLNYYIVFFTHAKNHCQFPHIQRLKLFHVRSEAMGLWQAAMWQGVHVLKNFCLLYFLFGSIPKSWVLTSFAIEDNQAVYPVNSIMGMLNVSLLWRTYVNAVVLLFSWTLAITLVKIFQTEHLEFPVVSAVERQSQNTLSEAMACSYSTLLQHLAFYDLCHLAKHSPSRRQELLSLSQPGGHPRVWTAISGTSLSILRELTDQVREENGAIVARLTLGSQPLFSTGDSSSSTAYFRGRSTLQSADGIVSSREETRSPSILSKASTWVSSLPLIAYLATPCPDFETRRLFASSQLHIWAVEALSHIASKSYKEDKYGVVQVTLSSIFATLLDLHEAIERHVKLTPSVSVRGSSSLACTLHSLTKGALYRMVLTYRAHLEDLRLSPDLFRRLQPFDEFSL